MCQKRKKEKVPSVVYIPCKPHEECSIICWCHSEKYRKTKVETWTDIVEWHSREWMDRRRCSSGRRGHKKCYIIIYFYGLAKRFIGTIPLIDFPLLVGDAWVSFSWLYERRCWPWPNRKWHLTRDLSRIRRGVVPVKVADCSCFIVLPGRCLYLNGLRRWTCVYRWLWQWFVDAVT